MARLATALLLASAPVLAQVPAEFSGEATLVEFAVRGAVQKHFRIRAGGTLKLSLTGPGQVTLDLREEALAPRQEAYILEMDGKPLAPQQLNTALDASVHSEKGLAVSRPMAVPVGLRAGRHLVRLQWPVDAAGDALLTVAGATIAAAPPELALLPLAPLPLAPLPLAPLPLAFPPPSAGATTSTSPKTSTSTSPKTSTTTTPSTTPSTSTSTTTSTSREPLPLAPLTAPSALPPPPPPPLAPLTPAPAKLSSETRPKVTVVAPAESSARPVVTLDLRAGADRSSESYTSPVALGRFGAELAYFAMPLLPVMLDFDLGFSRQQYQARQIAGDGHSLARAELDERRFDTALTAGYDLGPWLRGDGRLSALPFLGVQYSAFRNGGFPLDLFGVAAGARARWTLSPAIALQGGLRWAYNLLKGTTLSAVGTPASDLLLQAGISLPLSGGYAFDVGYRGDVLSLTYDTRVSHGMALGVHSGF
jgi:hypothetical protein